ncbi:sporulation histidine kinase inhibitor Sda [Brevibacillus sp. SYP-B805]|nr:sporulation histidine kinase inhibitor Sda [Brevibacillus sp. SYP-B805]NGQ94774.1 sporulation histidine kinase inhibitor Sda [Brevibacillus sp. SYP-B805]
MQHLSDEMLIEVYQRAMAMKLDQAFIELLHVELQRRNLIAAIASA